MDTYNKIQNLIKGDYSIVKSNAKGEDSTEIVNLPEDVSKFFERGNNSAGTRVRKAMQELKKLAQELREEVQEAKKP